MNKVAKFVLNLPEPLLGILAAVSIAIIVTPLAIFVMPQETNYFDEGYNAALRGIPPQACPYIGWRERSHEQWMRGWQEGFKKRETP